MLKIIRVLFVAILFILVLAASWIATCGIIKLITLCFGWTFSWGPATGVWLILLLIGEILATTK